MRQVSIVEDELQKTITSKLVNVEKSRKDSITPTGTWETLLEYGDYEKEILMGYLIIRKGEPKVPEDYSFVSEIHIKEETPLGNVSVYQKLMRQHTYTTLLLESAEAIAKGEHESRKIAVDYEPSSSVMFRRLGYEQEGNLMSKELSDIEQVCFLTLLGCMDLSFDENKNLIQNPVDADAAEKEWLRKFDEEYRQLKTCSL